MRAVAVLIPALLALVFGSWLGTFPGGAQAQAALATHLLVFAALASVPFCWAEGDRRLGALGGFAAIAWAASWFASPIPRAGTTFVATALGWLALPWCLARLWRKPVPATLSAAVGIISAWSLWTWRMDGTDGTSMPLGHHNLLAIFLLTLLPLTLLPWRHGGWRRGLAVVCGSLTLASLLATRSLAGALGLGALALVWGWGTQDGRWRRMIAVGLAGGAGLAVYGRRLLAIFAGDDPSWNARLAYLDAGWRGFLERPLLGRGPGSVAWTVHEHFRPVPGVHPPGQVLADLHSLPLKVLYELGVVGGVAVVAAAWWTFRVVRRREISDPGLARAGELGLLGFGVASLGGVLLSVTAIPVAVVVAAGAWIGAHEGPEARGGSLRWLAALAALALLAWQAPRDLAHLHWDRAAGAGSDEASVEHLRRAVDLDPSFPLYRWRLALLTADGDQALRAAEDARGVAPLWTTAGTLRPSNVGRREALDRACALSHFAAIPPLLWLRDDFDPAVAARVAAASPLLLASPVLDPPGRLEASLEYLDATGGVPGPWLRELRTAAASRPEAGRGDELRRLAYDVDGDAAVSLSLHAFRRTPWPARIAVVELRGDAIPPLAALPPATALDATDPFLFKGDSCRLGE